MPKHSSWLVRLSLLHFAFGAVLGSLLLADRGTGGMPWLWMLRPAHVEVLLFGFVIQLAVGVAMWIFPGKKGSTAPLSLVLAGVLLNLGIVLAATGGAVPAWSILAVTGRACELAALVLFAAHLWPRVRAARSHASGPVK